MPRYSSSQNAFIFSLMNPTNIPAKKYPSNNDYENYDIVSHISSGPIFNGKNLPDMDIYDLNGTFHCQIHFPSIYMTDIRASSFPSSHDCIINEMEVFIPVFKTKSLFWAFTSLIVKIARWVVLIGIEMIILCHISDEYDAIRLKNARISYFVGLVFLRLIYLYGQLILLQLIYLFFTIGSWDKPNAINLFHIRYEKRFLMLNFMFLSTFLIFF